jgi:hypothetical protein
MNARQCWLTHSFHIRNALFRALVRDLRGDYSSSTRLKQGRDGGPHFLIGSIGLGFRCGHRVTENPKDQSSWPKVALMSPNFFMEWGNLGAYSIEP